MVYCCTPDRGVGFKIVLLTHNQYLDFLHAYLLSFDGVQWSLTYMGYYEAVS